MNKSKVSKLISYWLRHIPQDVGIHLDEYGWADIEEILIALSKKGTDFSKEELIELNESFDKVRWKIDLNTYKIKATHGHSIAISQELESQTPPQTLYHGTGVKYLESIIESGLKSKNRQYVHLSEDTEIAIEVGKRHGKPFVIEIDSTSLHQEGWKFYKTEEKVWLTNNIPCKFLEFNSWYFNIDNETNKRFLKELKKEVNKEHLLFEKLDNLKLIGNKVSNDDCLFKNIENNEVYLVHLTWSDKVEKYPWPITKMFISFKDLTENFLFKN